jgi:hypothetical protein
VQPQQIVPRHGNSATPEKPDQDSLEMAGMENGDVENRSFEMQGGSAEGCNMHLVEVSEEDDVSQSPITQQTMPKLWHDQDLPRFFGKVPAIEYLLPDFLAIEREDESLDMKKPICAGKPVKQNGTTDVHNLSERARRDDIRYKITYLHDLIPNVEKADNASTVDRTIEYIELSQRAIEMMSSKINQPRIPQMALNMGVGMGMGMGLGMSMVDMGATGSGQGLIPVTSATGPAVPHNMSVPGMMMEAHDPHFINPNLMDLCNSYYYGHLYQAMQIQVSSSIQNTSSPVFWWFCVSLFMLTSRDWHLM